MYCIFAVLNFNENQRIMFNDSDIPNQFVPIEFPNGITLTIKREDLIHPYVSGNKFRKLKYNIQQAKNEKKHKLLTFGGAYSNHIASVASVGQLLDFHTIALIRGEELYNQIDNNPTLSFARSCGMELMFVPRTVYRLKHTADFLEELKKRFDNEVYVIPEGGTNELAVKGCEEILTEADQEFDVICTAVGTGGTISGLINSSSETQKILGFPALNGEFLTKEIEKYTSKTNWKLIHDYNFGGYAKVSNELIYFLNDFYQKTAIPLDPVYTGKMIFAIFALIKKGYFQPNTQILAIHTGGLQGIDGMNQKLCKQNKKCLVYD